MSADVGRRFSIDPQRVYLAGMSGGARVATGIALANTLIAGVIASSAGFPDSQPRTTVPFAVFAHRRHRGLQLHGDAAARSPAVVAAFPRRVPRGPYASARRRGVRRDRVDGAAGHAVGPAEPGRGAGRADAREEAQPDRRVDGCRRNRLPAARARRRLQGPRSTSPPKSGGSTALLRQSDVKKALKSERDSDDAEARMLEDIFALEAQLGDEAREAALMTLRERLSRLSRKAAAEADTPERSQARRVLRLVTPVRPSARRTASICSCSSSSACRAADQRPAGRA